MEVKDLEKNAQLSPMLPTTPTVVSNGRRVTISIPDSQLVANTTYRIALGDALTDNREFTPYKDFTYVFSTGPYFDSLELHGNVIDAQSGLKDSSILVVLYPASENDTVIMRKKPQYSTRIDASGNFSFKSLPQKAFKLYAVQDLNNNYIYDYGEEKIGFLNHEVVPSLEKDSVYTFYTFREVRDSSLIPKKADTISTKDTTQEKSSSVSERSSLNKEKPAVKLPVFTKLSKTNIGYKVALDTADLNKRTFDIRSPLTINLTTYIQTLDTAKVYLSYENDGIEVEAIQKLTVDSGKIKISTQWYGDKVYTLRLVKGWAKDSLNSEFPPGKYKFRTKGEQDYSSLIVHLGKSYFNDSLVLNIYKGTDSIYQKTIKDSIVTIKLLDPGSYGMRIIIDNNRNGKWDPGVLLQKKQPERIINFNTLVVLKAGWDNEVDFNEKTASDGNSKKPLMDLKDPKTPDPETEDSSKEER